MIQWIKRSQLLSKRLKRRIQELCGFTNLSREDKVIRANEILNSSDIKQSICNQILGCTFKDIERAMVSILNERQLTEEQKIQLELEKVAPQKFDPDMSYMINKKAATATPSDKQPRYRTLTPEETRALIEASKAPFESPPKEPTDYDYPTLSREEASRLVREHFEYKERERLKREGLWDSSKTTELETKTARTTKRSKSTKGSKR